MLARGDSVGVFQLESEGMRDALKKVRPTEFQDIVALVRALPPGRDALHPRLRQGQARPRQSVRYPDERLRRDHRVHLRLRDLPGAADGDRASRSPASAPPQADDLRKAIGKKKRDLMATMKEKFLEGWQASGTDPTVAKDSGR